MYGTACMYAAELTAGLNAPQRKTSSSRSLGQSLANSLLHMCEQQTIENMDIKTKNGGHAKCEATRG